VLLGVKSFIGNTIDTAWLDGLIRAKSVVLKYDEFDIVFCATVFHAMESLKSKDAEILSSLGRGQLDLLSTTAFAALKAFPVEIAFEGTKYTFQVKRAVVMRVFASKHRCSHVVRECRLEFGGLPFCVCVCVFVCVRVCVCV